MSNDLNIVTLIGRLTRDPELRHTNSGTAYARVAIACNYNFTSNGERKEEVSFFNCTAWGRLAEIINQYCKKGKQVAISGRLKQHSWSDQEGKNRSAIDVVIENLQMLGEKSESSTSGKSEPVDDDDIPF